jgi:phage gp36-like protein
MGYIERNDILNEISEGVLAELTSDSGIIEWAKVDKAIQDASALIDSYIGVRYTLPLESIPLILKKICKDITIYELYQQRVSENAISEVPEGVRKRYEQAVAFLKDIASGNATLKGVDEQGQAVTDESARKIRYKTRDKIFDDDWEDKYG